MPWRTACRRGSPSALATRIVVQRSRRWYARVGPAGAGRSPCGSSALLACASTIGRNQSQSHKRHDGDDRDHDECRARTPRCGGGAAAAGALSIGMQRGTHSGEGCGCSACHTAAHAAARSTEMHGLIYEMRSLPLRARAACRRIAEAVRDDHARPSGSATASARPGFWTTLIGSSNQSLTYMLAWESLAEREQKWMAFQSDPEWIAKRAETEKDGANRQHTSSTRCWRQRSSPACCDAAFASDDPSGLGRGGTVPTDLLVLLLTGAALTVVAQRIGAPYPALLAVAGATLGLRALRRGRHARPGPGAGACSWPPR